MALYFSSIMGKRISSNMSKKHILIFQSGEPLPCDSSKKRKMRAWNLVDELLAKDCKITLIGSRFDHTSKAHRKEFFYDDYHKNLKIHLINSPGYSKNISFKRFFDHIILSWNLFFFLKKIKTRPDAVFIGFPPIETSFVLFRWAKKMKSQIFLDVKDLWPEIFTYTQNKPKKTILKICFYPYFILYKHMVKNTDHLVSISHEFIEYLSQNTNRKSNKNIVTYLTSHKTDVSFKKNISNNDFLTLGFAGNFMDAFDFQPISTALNNINDKVKVKFILAGDGGLRDDVEEIFTRHSNVNFLGWLDGESLDNFFESIDLFVIPLKQRNDFSLSFPNKAMDALSRSKPILCSCSGSLTNFLENNDCGFYFDPKSSNELTNILNDLHADNGRIEIMKRNIENVYEKNFNHKDNYLNLAERIIESI